VTKDEKKHLSAVAELGCAVCRRLGFLGTPAEIHHLRAGQGMRAEAVTLMQSGYVLNTIAERLAFTALGQRDLFATTDLPSKTY